MADIDVVRNLIGDRKKAVTRELVCRSADGVQSIFQLDMYPIASAPTAALALWVSGITAATTTYVISASVGRVRFTPTAAGPLVTAGASIYADYTYHTLSSGDVSEFLSGHTGSPQLAAVNAVRAIAADYGRLGVYIQGNKTVNLDKVANKLLELAKDLETSFYREKDWTKYTGTVFTFKDNSGTPYHGYDSAVAYLNETS